MLMDDIKQKDKNGQKTRQCSISNNKENTCTVRINSIEQENFQSAKSIKKISLLGEVSSTDNKGANNFHWIERISNCLKR